MWTATDQAAAAEILSNMEKSYQAAVTSWKNSAVSQGPSNAQGQAATENALRQWRAALSRLRDQIKVGESTTFDHLQVQLSEIAEQKAVLRSLQSRHGTAQEQAAILDPKARSSPYTNILGFEKVFKPSTRMGIIIAAAVFAFAALVLLAWVVYRLVTVPAEARTSFLAGRADGVGGM